MKLAKTHIHFYGNKSSKSRFSDSSWCHFICSNNYIVTRECPAIILSREDAGSVSQRSMKEKEIKNKKKWKECDSTGEAVSYGSACDSVT